MPTKDVLHPLPVSPEIRGRITIDGKPLSGIQIIRSVDFGDTLQEEEAITCTSGEFHFSGTKEVCSANNEQPSGTLQSLIARHDGDEYLLWAAASPASIYPQELASMLSSLHCDLQNELKDFRFTANDAGENAKYEVETIYR